MGNKFDSVSEVESGKPNRFSAKESYCKILTLGTGKTKLLKKRIFRKINIVLSSKQNDQHRL
jgi:hypothetical protein